MLPVYGISVTKEECNDKNKSTFIKGFDNSCVFLHNITNIYSSCKIKLFNREIDDVTMEVLKQIIDYGIESGSPYSNIEIYCCRDLEKRIDFKLLKDNPIFRNIKIFQHPKKDIFHDRFLYIIDEEPQYEDIYLMGNSLSSIKSNPMSIAQIIGKCIVNLDESINDNLKKELKAIIEKSRIVYSKESL